MDDDEDDEEYEDEEYEDVTKKKNKILQITDEEISIKNAIGIPVTPNSVARFGA